MKAWAAALATGPALVAVALVVAPRLHVSDAVAAIVTFAGGALVVVISLSLAARAPTSTRVAVALAVAGAIAIVALAVPKSLPAASAIAVDCALLALGHAMTALLGRRVQDPGHLLPACVVAACADVASALHPNGPTHAIAESERALSVLAIAFPVPGTREVAPVLGAGDVLFLGLAFGVVAAHGLDLRRAAAASLVGIAIAGALSAWLNRPIPALVTIAAALLVALPRARRLRPADRTTAKVAMAIAVTAAAAFVLQGRFFSER